MGIPLFRERDTVAEAPQVKLPNACPYAMPATSAQLQRHHHHHPHSIYNSGAIRTFTRSSESMSEGSTEQHHHHHPHSIHNGEHAIRTFTEQDRQSSSQIADNISRLWRQMPQLHASRDHHETPVESNERSSAQTSSFQQRIVRSRPGTREHDDETRAAELVDVYFQELARIRAPSLSTSPDSSPSSEATRSRIASERALETVARRRRRQEANQRLPIVMDRRSMHEAMLRAHETVRLADRLTGVQEGTIGGEQLHSLDASMLDYAPSFTE